MLGRERLVYGPPIHFGLGEFVANDEFVFGRAAGELAGAHDQRAVVGQEPFAPADCVLDELFGAEVAKGLADVVNAELREPVVRVRTPFALGLLGVHALLS